MMRETYEARAAKNSNPLVSDIFRIIAEKKTNLCVSLDVTTTTKLLKLADDLGPYVCIFKTHIDIIDDFSYKSTIEPLVELSKKHNFLIFEDRKFADIGSTVQHQYDSGIYKIVNWAHLVTVHGVPGSGILSGLNLAAEPVVQKIGQHRGALMLAQLSSKGSLAFGEYTQGCVQMANESNFVAGFIAQSREATKLKSESVASRDWLILTPGVAIGITGDGLGQQYKTPEMAMERGSDVIIVGRGIIGDDKEPIKEAIRYREAAWNAYLKEIK
ncbi:hypothetical protein TBLA_0C01610 [Henningerozyma blattae CBS 6284]|uniref:Orotidine 5'-phosphate decarboxylase n=1 Tax=Henningerozyma blattae (strain ATCC 34711 / CBS 6284 / DSM 70876 / NBRC 10599 / NRRL Y-10934 / UCD 77-7) TaxID=1071380 RepID=I2H0S3_HENB6|nr:hypothetical protein TBLA_0C01610 [Tetrapisispora blattae CBS 6284]CCH59975.1 hypothetical protein TBLA_0C01610 [Tetrapisispora blattae CBS 6284]